MNGKTAAKTFSRRLVTAFIIIFFQVAIVTTVAQNETKRENCEKLADCLESFYKDCYGKDYLDSLSPKLVDSFNAAINQEDEMSRLDVYLTELQNNEKATGFVVVYGGRTNKFGEYDERIGRIKKYIRVKNFDQSRIKFVNGGFRENFEFELWTSNINNAFPPLSPTVAPEKVKFKGKMKPSAPGDSVL